MAEKSGDVNKSIDRLDPISTTAGAGSDEFFEKYADDYSETDIERRDMASDTDNDTAEETEHIKAQIEETRANMGETIDAIQEKLSFSNISEQVSEQVNSAIETAKDSVYDAIETAKDSAYEATIGKVVEFMKKTGNDISHSSIITTVQANPLPFILIGVGAGLLAYNGFGKKQMRSTNQYRVSGRTDYGAGRRSDYRNTGEGEYQDSHSGSSNRSVLSTAGETLGGVKDGISNVAGGAYDGVANAASRTYSGVGDVANRTYEKVGEFGTKAHETYDQYLEEKPWAIGAVALAVGAVVGMAIPSTRYEGQLMGEARYNLMSKAQDTATGLVDKAKQVATEAGKTITEEAKMATDKI